MSEKLTAIVTRDFNISPEKVWNGLTNPDLIKSYFFGTEAISDWKKGSTLEFKGEWEGTAYLDKGFILETEPFKVFRYSYLSSMSGLEDRPENYAEITYELVQVQKGTRLTVTQNGLANEERKAHSEATWDYLLEAMGKIIGGQGKV